MSIEGALVTVLKAILSVFFGGSGLYIIVTQALYFLGLWKIFEKSDIKGWWALIPWYREYKLGKCAGKEPEGRAIAVTAFFVSVIDFAGLFIKNEYIILLFGVFAFMAVIINVVYSIQVYTGLIDVYNVRKRWLWLWIFAEPIPALIWGFSKKYQPSWKAGEFRDNAVSHVQGGEIADMGEGLTVNLDKREVAEGLFHKKQLLKDIHMNIKPGRLVMLLGGSGAGKTTDVNAINGYEKADAKVMLNGRDVYKEYGKMQFECGFVPQSDLMRGKDTVQHKVMLNGRDVYKEYSKMQFECGFVPQPDLMRGKDTVQHTLMDYAALRLPSDFTLQDRKDRVEEALKLFGLGPVRNSMVSQLSGGQRKRLSIAMEFLSNPTLLILDEPDSGVDGVMAKELFKQMRKVADTGRIVIPVSQGTHTYRVYYRGTTIQRLSLLLSFVSLLILLGYLVSKNARPEENPEGE